MLYDRKQMARDQVLSDLTALKARITMPGGWLKGGFIRDGGVCIVQAAKTVIDRDATTGGFVPIEQGTEDVKDIRLGRMIVTIYRALKGPKANLNITVQDAQSAIASFNDSGETTVEAVCLLIDRAIALIIAPIGEAREPERVSGSDYIASLMPEKEAVTA